MFSVLSPLDFLAVGWFLFAWLGFNIVIDTSPWRTKTLSHAMNEYRRHWMLTMATREVRIMDTAILSGLQHGTAFFASAALLAIGAGFTLLDSTEIVLRVAGDLSIPLDESRTLWEIKVLGLMAIIAYSFFKFGWAYRLFNYASIVMGAVPERGQADPAVIQEVATRAADLNMLAGRHFNLGQRAWFFAIAFLGWFAGPEVFAAATLAVLLVLLRRQFASRARAAALSGQKLKLPSPVSPGEYTDTGSSNPFTS
ncbi:MAG: DUF599 family protein [Roseibium sp.]|nr:DUF599 family protein [Roseibium sp.]